MKINGNDYNFGRVVYLTIARISTDTNVSNVANLKTSSDVITIAFDPKKNPQLNTRIDFWVKHTGQSLSSNIQSCYALANIDVYNIGPALTEFISAYNSYETEGGRWKVPYTQRYACALQVGYEGGKRTTIFAGFIGSYNLERRQNNSTVDNIWHFYAQYPGGNSENIYGEYNKAISGADYSQLAKQWLTQTFVSGEEYIKAAVMARPRETYAYVAVPQTIPEESFSVEQQYCEIPTQTDLVALPALREINNENFDSFYRIRYQNLRTGKEYPQVKEMWQKQEPMQAWNMSYDNLPQALSEIAAKKNCYATIQLDENTGMQTIYIYPAGAQSYKPLSRANFVIIDFQNLRRPPAVSGSMIQLDMLMEPSARPGNTFELKVTAGFIKQHLVPSFGVNFEGNMANANTMFAGGNFLGLANIRALAEKKKAGKGAGNIFGNKYIAVFVVHQGSTHEAEWSTTVDCMGVVLGDGTVGYSEKTENT